MSAEIYYGREAMKCFKESEQWDGEVDRKVDEVD